MTPKQFVLHYVIGKYRMNPISFFFGGGGVEGSLNYSKTEAGFQPYLENLEFCHFLFQAWKMPGICSKSIKNLKF